MAELTLVKRKKVARGIDEFYFEGDYEYKAGNYAVLKNEVGARPFTISSKPSDKLIRFTIKKEGDFTHLLWDMKEGETIEAEGPYGKDIEEIPHEHIVFVCAGTGVTPSIAMHGHSKDKGLNKTFKLIYSVSYWDDIIPTEIEDSIITITRDNKEGYEYGRIDENFVQKHVSKKELEEALFIVCGPLKMEREIKKILTALGAKHIKKERG